MMVTVSRTLLVAALTLTATASNVICENGSLIESTGKCCYGIGEGDYCCVKDLATASCIGLCSPDGSDCLAKVDYDDPDFDQKVQDALKNGGSSSSGTSSSSGSTPTSLSIGGAASTATSTGSGSAESTSASESGSTIIGVYLKSVTLGMVVVSLLLSVL